MRTLLSVVPLLCAAGIVQPALAARRAPLVIHSASVDGGVLSVRGSNFGNAAPNVTLADVPLVVISNTQDEIRALLPDPTPPGSYLLLVARNPRRTPSTSST